MSARCIFSFVVHLVMDLWYTCDAFVDFDGLVDLFGWIWALIIIYVIYIVMDVICVDGWDIYVMDEIYMWYMFVWIYLSWWNIKKIKNYRFGSLCRVLHSAKDPFAECNGHSTRQSWKNGRPENRFSSFAECCDSNTRQRNLKKNLNFAECLSCWHSTKSFF